MRTLNKYECKEMLLNGKPQWQNFTKDDLIFFLEVAKELLNDHKATKVALQEARDYVNNYDVFKEFSFPLMKRDEEQQVKTSIKYEFDKTIKKDLLEILEAKYK